MPTTIEYSPIDYDTGKLLDPVKFVITDYEAAIEGSHLAERIQREYRRSLIKMCDKCKFLKGASYHTCEVKYIKSFVSNVCTVFSSEFSNAFSNEHNNVSEIVSDKSFRAIFIVM